MKICQQPLRKGLILLVFLLCPALSFQGNAKKSEFWGQSNIVLSKSIYQIGNWRFHFEGGYRTFYFKDKKVDFDPDFIQIGGRVDYKINLAHDLSFQFFHREKGWMHPSQANNQRLVLAHRYKHNWERWSFNSVLRSELIFSTHTSFRQRAKFNFTYPLRNQSAAVKNWFLYGGSEILWESGRNIAPEWDVRNTIGIQKPITSFFTPEIYFQYRILDFNEQLVNRFMLWIDFNFSL